LRKAVGISKAVKEDDSFNYSSEAQQSLEDMGNKYDHFISTPQNISHNNYKYFKAKNFKYP